jgi:hypothetical protein
MDEYQEIFEQNLTEIEKLTQGFDWLTRMYIDSYANQVELTRAIQDSETLVKEQIKLEMIRFVRGMFNDCHYRATGRRAWNE